MNYRIRDTRNDETAKHEVNAEEQFNKAVFNAFIDSMKRPIGYIVKKIMNSEDVKHLTSKNTTGRLK